MSKSRILIIEDDSNIRMAMEKILTRFGYEIESTPYLATALSMAIAGDYDLITLDLNMPGIDGKEIAQLFQHRNLDTPVLVISGYLDESVETELREKGVKHFLAKPFNISTLPKAIEKALAG